MFRRLLLYNKRTLNNLKISQRSNLSSEKAYKDLSEAMRELGGVVPKWSPPTSDIIEWSRTPDLNLSSEKLTVLARAHFEEHPPEVPVNKQRAYELWKLAKSKGSVEATYCVAVCHLKGHGVKQDIKRAFNELVEMNEITPYAPAEFVLAKLLRQGDSTSGLEPDPIRAFHYLIGAADKGHVRAQYHTANAYWMGDGVERSEIMGLHWFQAAAEGGSRDARFVLGTIYSQGLADTNEEENHKEIGFDHYLSAAKAGDVRAMFNVGIEYLKNDSGIVERDVHQANEWFKKSAKSGYPPAIVNRGNMYRDGLVGAINGKPDWNKAADIYKQGADRGDELCKKLFISLKNSIK
jgi:TPR repeat protein